MHYQWETIARTESPAQTKRLAESLADCLEPGDVVLLSGDLGAGKTQFVQGVAARLGASAVPTSPTFNIVLSYETDRFAIHHFDLYRLDSPDQLEDIGLREYLESGGVCFVEWAEKFPEAFAEFLALDIVKESEGVRLLRAHAKGARGADLLAGWMESEAGEPRSKLEAGKPEAAAPEADAPGAAAPEAAAPGADEAEVPAREASALGLRGPARTDGEMHVGRRGQARGRRFEAVPPHGRPMQEYPDSKVAPGAQVVVAFDTANEVVALGVGVLDKETRTVEAVATRQVAAHRASNTTLLPQLDSLLAECGIARSHIACVCAGRGPGSFTGVRIAMATAKGIAQALGVGLIGVSSLDAIAHNAQDKGVRGNVCVVADAMRKEVYPVRFALFDDGVRRLGADRVVKADAFAGELAAEGARAGECEAGSAADLLLIGDALVKYRQLFEPYGAVLSDKLWEVTGNGLLLAFQQAWAAGDIDPFDAARHDPAFSLPVYTRLSDAEEHERARLSRADERNLVAGVQDVAPDGGKGRATMHSQAKPAVLPDACGIAYRPLDASHASAVARLESQVMGSDAWSERLVADELGQRMRIWWVAQRDEALVGYVGAMVVDGDMQVLKVAVAEGYRRLGIARSLFVRAADDARNLGASTCSLEVRASNEGARAFYASLGLESLGVRPRYYSDREDAVIMKGALPQQEHDVAGMALQHLDGSRGAGDGVSEGRAAAVFASGGRDSSSRVSSGGMPSGSMCGGAAPGGPFILAIETSCDETAAAVVCADGGLMSDVVASQIDFHARFGGVVPEIASRKHIEAVCGVCAEGLGVAGLAWRDLDAVAVTYAPGLLGALVVGVAYAKGAAWALDVPLIRVNHLEGHLYANKLGAADFAPPAVVSLLSGGNTMLVHMRDWGDYRILGETIDDAVGEAFDKVSKALGLGYPGGPVISRHAASGDPHAIAFPRAMMHSHDLRFSLSGLKTAVVNYINKERSAGRPLDIADISASFQQAVIDVQVAKTKTALEQTGAKTFCLGGGVAANPALRQAYERLCASMGVRLVMPPLSSCGDNAGMIALAALDRYRLGKFSPLDADAHAHADLEEPY